MKLEGLGILVEDMAAMVRFYRDVLGFAIREDEDAENVYLEKDGTLFLLYRRRDFEVMLGRRFDYVQGLNGRDEIALGAEDYAAVDAAFARVTAAGERPAMEPRTMPRGQRTCCVADPEGNLLKIGSFNP